MRFPERRTSNVLLTILLFAAICAIAYWARHVILLFVLSVFFAYLMNPAVKFLQHHPLIFKDFRGAAVTEAYVGILILIALATYTFAPVVTRNTVRLVDQVPVTLDRLATGDIATDVGDKYDWSDPRVLHSGRHGIFSLRMRYVRVVLFIPRRAAAPPGPPITQFDSRSARKTCSRSASSGIV